MTNHHPTQDAQAGPDEARRSEAPTSIHAARAAEPAFTTNRRVGHRDHVRRAAEAFLDAWDGRSGFEGGITAAMDGPMAGLRAALTLPPSASVKPSHPPKDTKQAQVLAMLARDEGASGPAIAEAMGWAPHTVRGFLAGLAKKGIKVEVLERVRQVGPKSQGAKGSYTVYRMVESG
jgi:Protein of unknown function (DUF3489)